LPLNIKALVEPGHVSWMRLVELMSSNPARILGLKKGSIGEGDDADIVIFDPKRPWTIDPANFKSKSRNCPFGGWSVTGRVVATIVDGVVKYEWPEEVCRY
jgi:dihydroorotase